MALRRKKWVRWIVSWLPHRLTIAIRSLLRWEHLVIAKVRHRWHRSLQLRVVGTTLVISATMIAVLGFFLTEQIADGLLLNAETSARAQVLTGLSTAQSQSGLTTHAGDRAGRDAVMGSIGLLLQPTQRHGQLQRGRRAERGPGGRAGLPALGDQLRRRRDAPAHPAGQRAAGAGARTGARQVGEPAVLRAHHADPHRRQPGHAGDRVRRAARQLLPAVLRVPAQRRAADPAARPDDAHRRGDRARGAARGDRLAGDPVGGAAGAARGGGRAAAVRGQA